MAEPTAPVELRGFPRAPRALWIAFGLVALTLALYVRVGGHDFVNFDDGDYVYDNAHVRAGLTARSLRWSLTAIHSSNWHPLTTWSHLLDVELFGLDAGAHHLVSVALHALAAVLLYLALRRLTGAAWTSALVAALFAVHPLRVESVAWASERKDVLSGALWMATLLAYAGYARRPGALRYLLVTVVFGLGLLAKPMVVTLPLVLLLLDAWPLARCCPASDGDATSRGTPWSRLVLEKVPWLVMAALAAAVTVLVQSRAGSVRALEELPLTTRVAGALSGYGMYLGKSVWPSGLAFYYPHPGVLDPDGFGLASPAVLASAALLAALSVLAWRVRRRAPFVAVGWCWFVVTLLPVIGLVQVGEQWWADRYAYVPLVGVHVAVAFGLARLVAIRPGWRTPVVATSLAALAALAAVTWRQVAYWQDDEALYERALAVTTENYMAHNNLGLAQLEAGRAAEAEQHFRDAVRIRPADPKARVNLGIALARQGELAAGREELEAVVRERPGFAPGHSNLASLLARMNEVELAREHYLRASELDPSLPGPHFNLAKLHLRQGNLDGAAAAAARLARLGRFAEAIAIQTDVVERSPADSRDAARARLQAYRAGRTGPAEGGRP